MIYSQHPCALTHMCALQLPLAFDQWMLHFIFYLIGLCAARFFVYYFLLLFSPVPTSLYI